MAAGVARYVVAFLMRLPDMAETFLRLGNVLGKTDIGAACFLVRPLIPGLVCAWDDQRAGKKIGEMGIVVAGKIAATLPKGIRARTVKGDHQQLLWPLPHILRHCTCR
ncbi:hypothetical protein D3C87_1647550 [compost metagenome]